MSALQPSRGGLKLAETLVEELRKYIDTEGEDQQISVKRGGKVLSIEVSSKNPLPDALQSVAVRNTHIMKVASYTAKKIRRGGFDGVRMKEDISTEEVTIKIAAVLADLVETEPEE